MRQSVFRYAAAKAGAAPRGSPLFSAVNERALLENLLLTPQPPRRYPFVDVRDALVAQSRDRSSAAVQRKRIQQGPRLAPAPRAEPSSAARQLMGRPAVSSQELAQFLAGHYLQGVPPFERRQRIHDGIMDLISASTANNLRTLMQFLSLYWQIGVAGTRPLIYDARRQARTVLIKSLQLHPETRFDGGGEQLGVPDFARFAQFVHTFFEYLGVPESPNDELHDLLLRLQARSGSLTAATAELVARRGQVDDETMQQYLHTLARSRPDAAMLESVRPLLINDNIGPRAVNFLLPMLPQHDVMSLLELVDQSSWRNEIYEQCQTEIVQAALRTAESPMQGLAMMFGVIHRIRKRTPLSSATVNVALEAAKAQQNESAIATLEALL